jgi:HEAT repeat protein
VRPVVLRASRDKSVKVREAALRGLVDGPLKSPADLLALAGRAAEDGELSLPFRAEAVKALTATRDRAVIPVLVKLVETGPRAKIASPPKGATEQQLLGVRYLQIGDVRAWAAQGLGELGDRSVLPVLLKASEDPDDFFLRYIVAGVLIGWRERGALPALVRLLGDPAREVRTVAVVGVGVLGDQGSVEVVAGRLQDDDVDVRVKAVEALAVLGGEKARQRLQAAQATEVHPQVRQALEAALARLGRQTSRQPDQGRVAKIALSRLRVATPPPDVSQTSQTT